MEERYLVVRGNRDGFSDGHWDVVRRGDPSSVSEKRKVILYGHEFGWHVKQSIQS